MRYHSGLVSDLDEAVSYSCPGCSVATLKRRCTTTLPKERQLFGFLSHYLACVL